MALEQEDEEDVMFGELFSDYEGFLNCNDGPMIKLSEMQVNSYFLKENLATELYDILNCVHHIFNYFGITYWLTGGSLIGQLRHKGIIPWDDDVDVCCFMNEKEKILSTEVINTFRMNNLFIEEDHLFNIVNPFLLKVYRNTAPSKATKCGRVPYPFCDIFFMREADEFDRIDFYMAGQSQHIIYSEELYPIQIAKFGPVMANIPAQPKPQLERGYGKNWDTQGQIHTVDHITKQGKGGPRQVFDVKPFLNVSAKCKPTLITPVSLPKSD